jgi:ABC-type transport system substrate-binding protein
MTGPYIHQLQYKAIPYDDEQVLALKNGEIDAISYPIDPSFIQDLEEHPDVEIEQVIRNGYGYLTINCAKYPLNITAFRRAFAFAFNKTEVVEEIWEGLAVAQDSLVPQANPYSIEGDLPYNYYDANIALANELLDEAGFDDIDSDGFREAPDGSDFDILVECAQSSNIAIEVGAIAADALTSIGIDAVSEPTDFYEYLNRLYFHGDYDVVFLGSSYSDFSLEWLAYEFWSHYADEPYWNFPNFRNESYDFWRDQLLTSPYLEGEGGVLKAAEEMQKIWIYESPMIIAYDNILAYVHRTDRFTEWVVDVSNGFDSSWTNMQVKLKDAEGGPLGGLLRVGVASTGLSTSIQNNLYDTLFMDQPDGSLKPWVAESYIVETNDNDSSIPVGHTRYTFNIVDNHTWSDGEPLTSADVVFSLNYYHNNLGNSEGVNIEGLETCYAPTSTQVVVVLSSSPFWHLHEIANAYILPQHEDVDDRGYVTSGPFFINGSSIYNLTTYPNHFKYNSMNVPRIEDDGLIPDIVAPETLIYTVGETGNQLVWSISDSTPANYTILQDSVIIVEENWNSNEAVVTVNVDDLDVGSYNFTLIATDYFGNTNSSSVLVEVQMVFDIILVVGGIGGVSLVVIIVVVILRSRPSVEYYEYG